MVVLFGIQAKDGECKPLGVCENCSPSKSVSSCIFWVTVTCTCRVNIVIRVNNVILPILRKCTLCSNYNIIVSLQAYIVHVCVHCA